MCMADGSYAVCIVVVVVVPAPDRVETYCLLSFFLGRCAHSKRVKHRPSESKLSDELTHLSTRSSFLPSF